MKYVVVVSFYDDDDDVIFVARCDEGEEADCNDGGGKTGSSTMAVREKEERKGERKGDRKRGEKRKEIKGGGANCRIISISLSDCRRNTYR